MRRDLERLGTLVELTVSRRAAPFAIRGGRQQPRRYDVDPRLARRQPGQDAVRPCGGFPQRGIVGKRGEDDVGCLRGLAWGVSPGQPLLLVS